ncbi:uncharacterized protein BP01DRAFT_153306 [Aspergillus saccharolyticus JOP 1030-1]|uniref:Uncharacterized protein n=1 Tax=Aspergillus saccharolyticus JOP 1030-1 TaxID=1450539 RepID=A0A318ZNW3_9EURO|nr:hypothetical protein BP01DRAFT_153306 [Aspergillus saccharolyticus JOP 1030-1]PYH48667.1 hypothetical protein BP01DRAFT_153306 [Aspergillus saccharolyticus JOP 1030-1]
MYQIAAPLDLDYLNQQLLPRQYESEEEETSESELGSHDHAFSPIKTAGPFDSDMSADEASNVHSPQSPADKTAFARLLSTYPATGKSSRPVSLDTVKRSSGTTFVPESYIFGDDDDVIIELPSPDNTSTMQSPVFLQPTVYQPPQSQHPQRRSRSSSPCSIFSVDDSVEESDVCVAEQVTIVGPVAKPNLILISPVTDGPLVDDPEPMSAISARTEPDHFATGKGLYSLHQAIRSQPLLSEKRADPAFHLKRGSLQLHSRSAMQHPRRADTDPFVAPRALADVPEAPQPSSMRSQSMAFHRPQTSAEHVSSRGPKGSSSSHLRRPPSLQTVHGGYSPFPPRQTSMHPADEFHSRSMSVSHSFGGSDHSLPPSRTSSPMPYYSSPTFNRHRSGSSFSTSSMSGPRGFRPPTTAGSLLPSSTASSVYSASSLRSEVESVYSLDSPATSDAKTARRKKSFRYSRSAKPASAAEPAAAAAKSSSSSGFIGFMLRGRRKSTIHK